MHLLEKSVQEKDLSGLDDIYLVLPLSRYAFLDVSDLHGVSPRCCFYGFNLPLDILPLICLLHNQFFVSFLYFLSVLAFSILMFLYYFAHFFLLPLEHHLSVLEDMFLPFPLRDCGEMSSNPSTEMLFLDVLAHRCFREFFFPWISTSTWYSCFFYFLLVGLFSFIRYLIHHVIISFSYFDILSVPFLRISFWYVAYMILILYCQQFFLCDCCYLSYPLILLVVYSIQWFFL